MPALLLQRLPVEAPSAPAERHRRDLVVGVAEARLVEAHRAARRRKISLFGSASPSGAIAGVVREHVQVPVRLVHVEVLELRRRRQHVVGVVGRVGLEVLEHDGEQVFAREAGRDGARLRRDRDRVAVVDDQRLDRRVGRLAQRSRPSVLMLIVRGVRPASRSGR